MRIARYTPTGEVHHVISRFIDKEWFITTPDERSYYLRLLGKALTKSDWVCLAYALMSSHLHLAMVAGRMEAESWSRRVNPPFANYYNELHERIGPLFAGRADMRIERTERIGRLLAYVHNNPVRAGVVARASESDWTSHRAYIGATTPPPWLNLGRGLELSGIESAEFDEWVHSERLRKRKDLDLKDIDREAKRLGSIVLGTPTVEPLDVPLLARPFARVRPHPGRIVDVVQDVLGMPASVLFHRARGGRGVEGRAVAVRVGRCFGIPMSSMAAALGISAQSASRLYERPLTPLAESAIDVISGRFNGELGGLMARRTQAPDVHGPRDPDR
jgi:hypothetical protein